MEERFGFKKKKNWKNQPRPSPLSTGGTISAAGWTITHTAAGATWFTLAVLARSFFFSVFSKTNFSLHFFVSQGELLCFAFRGTIQKLYNALHDGEVLILLQFSFLFFGEFYTSEER